MKFTGIVLKDRSDAERVLELMQTIIEKYEVVTLADMYELCGIPSTYVDDRWGWTSLTNVQVVQKPTGYVIDLPPAVKGL